MLYVFQCDTPNCKGTYKAPKASRRRYCDKCVTKRITNKPKKAA